MIGGACVCVCVRMAFLGNAARHVFLFSREKLEVDACGEKGS